MKLKNDIHSNFLVITNIDIYRHYYRAKSASYKKYRKDQIWNKFTVLCWARLFYDFRIHLKQVHFLIKLLNSTVLIEFAFYICFSFVQSKKGQNVRWLPQLFVTRIYNVWKTSLKEVVRVRICGYFAVLGLASVTTAVIANSHEKMLVGCWSAGSVWVMTLQRSQDDDKDKWSQRQTNLYSIAYLRKEVER